MRQSDPYNLNRFVEAQQTAFDDALAELRAGRKHSHWMWFIFPQIAGLGQSPTAIFYAIRSIGEARAYLEHDLVGPRLRTCAGAVLDWAGRRSADQILGSIDAMKLRSSMTLFDSIDREGQFRDVLTAFFDGKPDERTLALLGGAR